MSLRGCLQAAGVGWGAVGGVCVCVCVKGEDFESSSENLKVNIDI